VAPFPEQRKRDSEYDTVVSTSRYFKKQCSMLLEKKVVNKTNYSNIYFFWRCGPKRTMASSFKRYLDQTQRRITDGSTPPDELSACCKDHYMKTHNTHKGQTSMTLAGFEPTVPAG